MKTISFDIETNAQVKHALGEIVTMQWCNDKKEAEVHCMDDGVNKFTQQDLDALQLILNDNVVIGQNLAFESTWLAAKYGMSIKNPFDIMLAEYLIQGAKNIGMKNSNNKLDTIIMKYTGIKLEKNEDTQLSFRRGKPLTPEQEKYALEDVIYCQDVYIQQSEKLKEMGLMEAAQIEMDCIAATADMHNYGIYVDIAGTLNVQQEYLMEAERKKTAILKEFVLLGYGGKAKQMSLTGEPTVLNVNLASNVQLKKILEDCLDITLPNVDDYTLSTLEHPIGEMIRGYRTQEKAANMLTNIPKIAINSRIYSDFFQYGTKTSRYTSKEPNMQNIKRESRKYIFVAPEGTMFINGDFEQMELKILADISGDITLINAFKNKTDLHALTASLIFKQPLENYNKKNPNYTEARGLERSIAKTLNFGNIYGMGAPSFKKKLKAESNIEITVPQAKTYLMGFAQGYPVASQYLRYAGYQAMKHHYTRSASGRLMIYDASEEQYKFEKYGRNHPIQATCSDIVKTAMGKLHNDLKLYDAKLVNTIHDELLIQIDKTQDMNACMKMVEKDMVQAGEKYLKTVNVTVDIKLKPAWSKD